MIKKFVIVAPPRVGSNLLLQVLNNTQSRICCYPELFHPLADDIMKNERFMRPRIPYFRTTGLSTSSYLSQVVWPAGKLADASIGFKLQLHLPSAGEICRCAQASGAEFVYLARIDKPQMVLSFLIAQACKTWWHFQPPTQQSIIRLEPRTVLQTAKLLDHAEAEFLAFLPKSTFVLTYEELLASGVQSVLAWLGYGDSPKTNHSSIPIRSPEKCQVVENYDAVLSILQDYYRQHPSRSYV